MSSQTRRTSWVPTFEELQRCDEEIRMRRRQVGFNPFNINATPLNSGLAPLELALQTRNVFMLQVVLRFGADTEQTNAQGATSLTTAIRYGYLECVKLLVEYKANVNACTEDGKPCLLFALEQEQHSIARYLLELDSCELDVCGTDGHCLLQLLVLANDASLISSLKSRGVNLNTRCPDGTVAVLFAIAHCKTKALKGLLEAGADPDIGTENGLTPIHVAIKKKCLPILRLLLDGGANIEQNIAHGLTPLLAACSMGYMEGVQLLVERGANLEARSLNGMTSLLIASEKGYQSIADYLRSQGSHEVNEVARDGFGALHRAVTLNRIEEVRRLIQLQADVNIQTHDGEAPVFLAAKHGNLEVLRILLGAGAVPNIDTKDGDFALHEAVKFGDVEAVELLLQHGADRERLDKSGMTAVEVAMELTPPPQDIIHCLLTDYKDDQGSEVSHPTADQIEDSKKIFDAEAEEALCCCPITCEIMKDPVIAIDGHTYEREAIEGWLRENRESPVTRQPLTSSTLIPNLSVKHLIERFANVDDDS